MNATAFLGAKAAAVAAFITALGVLPCGPAAAATAAPGQHRLNLNGYATESGAITILHGGDASDPYFTLQALLLAHDNAMDITAPALKFMDWLVPHQKPDGTFDRFCQKAGQWTSCKTADADDSLLAMWLRLLQIFPSRVDATPALSKSRTVSRAALEHLYQPSRGVYMVSPVYLHGLFMDNLEVWSFWMREPAAAQRAMPAERLARAIHETFWQPVNKNFLVSTQLEQRGQPAQFYPDHVAQVFPLMVDFPLLPSAGRAYYSQWMRQHRAAWLAQGQADYPWGIIAVLALRQNDLDSASCWMRESAPLRHSARWAVTDEVSMQILVHKGVRPAGPAALCG